MDQSHAPGHVGMLKFLEAGFYFGIERCAACCRTVALAVSSGHPMTALYREVQTCMLDRFHSCIPVAVVFGLIGGAAVMFGMW